MNLAPILEYQKYDVEIAKLLNEIEKNDNNKKLEQAKNEFASAKQGVEDSEKTAGSILDSIAKTGDAFNNAFNEAEALIAKIASLAPDDLEAHGEAAAKLEQLFNKISSYEKRTDENLKKKSGDVIKDYLDSQAKGQKLKDLHAKFKQALEVFKQEREPKIAELIKKRDAVAGVDPALKAEYVSLTNDKKIPAVAAVTISGGGKNYFCFCGMDLNQKTKDELNKAGVCRCDRCKRIVYRRP